MKYSTRRHKGGVSITIDGNPITEERAAQIMETLEMENAELKKAGKDLAYKAGLIRRNAMVGQDTNESGWITLDNSINKMNKLIK